MDVVLGLLKLAGAFFASVLKWIREHPKTFCSIVLLTIMCVVAFKFGEHVQEKEDNKIIFSLGVQVKKANEDAKARNEKITRIETESKANAQAITTELEESKKQMVAVMSDYERKLKIERANFKVIYVKDKDGKDVEVDLNPKGEVVCRNMPQTFVDTVNSMVQEANKPVILTPAKEIQQ